MRRGAGLPPPPLDREEEEGGGAMATWGRGAEVEVSSVDPRKLG